MAEHTAPESLLGGFSAFVHAIGCGLVWRKHKSELHCSELDGKTRVLVNHLCQYWNAEKMCVPPVLA